MLIEQSHDIIPLRKIARGEFVRSDSVEAELMNTVIRYIDEYGWGWGIALKLINRKFTASLTDKELREIYCQAKEACDD